MKLVFVSHTADQTTFKVGSHHYARELAGRGFSVLHMSTPHSRALEMLGRSDGRRSLAGRSPHVDESGVTHVVPTRWLPARLAHRYLDLRPEVERTGFGDADWVLIDQPLMHRAATAFEASTKICYRPTDLYLDGAYAAGQKEVLRRADAVLATSPMVLEDLGVPDGTPSTVIENGVDLGRFVDAARQSSGRSGAVYVGALDDRFDWDALGRMAEALADVSADPIRVFGPHGRRPAGVPDNVDLRGPVPYEDVPRILASARIGVMPFTRTRLNQGRSPMKMYEFIAAGLPVVGPSYLDRLPAQVKNRLFLYATNDSIESCVRSAWAAGVADVSTMLLEESWAYKTGRLVDFLSAVR